MVCCITSVRDLNWSGFAFGVLRATAITTFAPMSLTASTGVFSSTPLSTRTILSNLTGVKTPGKDIIARIAIGNEPLLNRTDSPLTRSVATQRKGIGS